MEILSLKNTGFDTLFRSFENAFADYPVKFGKEEVRSMLTRRGYNPELSFAAFDNGEIVSFILNGTGTFCNIPSAYDTGIGTIQEYRGKGIATEIFNYSLAPLRQAGIRQYVLEVLQDNEAAVSLYTKTGFGITREFDCFRQDTDLLRCNGSCMAASIAAIDIDSVNAMQHFCDFNPSWQNSIQSLNRGISGLKCIGATVDNKTVGFCVFDPSTGDISQLAVHHGYRRRGIASKLLHEAAGMMRTSFVKVLNIDAGCESMHAFLASAKIPLASRQYEMTLNI